MSAITPPSASRWSLSNYFDKILCINRASRIDRWQHCLEQFGAFQISDVERIEAVEVFNIENRSLLAWNGCTASHRLCLEIASRHQRTLVLEDDFEMRFRDFHLLFEFMLRHVPLDWDMLYLGGHYGEAPISRVSPCVLRCARMMGISSYGITAAHASRVCSHMRSSNQADCVFSGFSRKYLHYVLQPRLIVQSTGYSDLCGCEINPSISMTDTLHENLV